MGTLSPEGLLLLATAGTQPEGDGHFRGWGERSQASWGGLCNTTVTITTMAVHRKSEGEEEEEERRVRPPIISMVWGTKRK